MRDPERPQIVYFRVPTPPYPRSQRISDFLARHDIAVSTVVGRKFAGMRSVKDLLDDFRQLWMLTQRGKYVILAELQIRYAAIVVLIVRIRGAKLVVDNFVGLEETVDDRAGDSSGASIRRMVARALDDVALRGADWVLVDTDLRREHVVARGRASARRVLTLPVGAPAWARTGSPIVLGERMRVLYYGNYIPLHGVEHLVRAVRDVEFPVELTLVGDGETRKRIEELVDTFGSARDRFVFLPPVPEGELGPLLQEHDVVAGIFGGSTKASSVIANKVWQGLSMDRWVVTRRSEALGEIAAVADAWLVQVEPEDATAIGRALGEIRTASARGPVGAGAALEEYVERRYVEAFSSMGLVGA